MGYVDFMQRINIEEMLKLWLELSPSQQGKQHRQYCSNENGDTTAKPESRESLAESSSGRR
jgi:hypothetical protein